MYLKAKVYKEFRLVAKMQIITYAMTYDYARFEAKNDILLK